jgi:hypothetical protein
MAWNIPYYIKEDVTYLKKRPESFSHYDEVLQIVDFIVKDAGNEPFGFYFQDKWSKDPSHYFFLFENLKIYQNLNINYQAISSPIQPISYLVIRKDEDITDKNIKLKINKKYVVKEELIFGAYRLIRLHKPVYQGFYNPEKWPPKHHTWRWSKKRGIISIPKKDTLVKLTMQCNHPDLRDNPVTVRLFLDNRVIDEITFTDDRRHISKIYFIPDSIKGIPQIRLEVSRTWNPSHYGSKDTRDLGIAVREIEYIDKSPLFMNGENDSFTYKPF